MIAKIRPQVMAGIVGLIILGVLGLLQGGDIGYGLAGTATGGLIALAKDLIAKTD